MEVTNCKDISGNEITNIRLNPDGTVLAVLEVDGVESTSHLNAECCTSNSVEINGEIVNFTFDPNDTKCYWNSTCDTGGAYKIVLDPEGNAGALFQIDDNQIGDCTLEVEFDYLLRFNCGDIESLKTTLETITLELSLEKVIYDESLPIPDNLVSVQKEYILNIPDIVTFLDGNTNTGLLIEGEGCDALKLNLINELNELGEDSLVVSGSSFNSTWVRYKMIIDDPDVLESIYNERLKVVLIGNRLCDFSILVDNVKLNRICDTKVGEVFLKDDCPSFNLRRIIDNKKSWVENVTTETRVFDLTKRETKYSIDDERLSINTKEIDLLINPSVAIENDVWKFVQENPCILEPSTGCTSGTTTHECVDINELITTPITELIDGTDLLNELIDVKSRKTLSCYPLIELLYYRYINSQEHCGVVSSALNTESVNSFVDLIGAFWSDIIEQVVPATTIWGSSYQHSNNIFGVDKFEYRKSTTLLCTPLNFEAPSPTSGSNLNVGVITTDITPTGYVGPPEFAPTPISDTCNGVSVIQINDGSEFIGTVTITGGGGGPVDPGDSGNEITGNTITINETISEGCDIYNSRGDWEDDDWSEPDWNL